MKPLFIYDEPKPVTFGELCEALADGVMPNKKEVGYFNVRKAEVSRLAEVMAARQARKTNVESESCTV